MRVVCIDESMQLGIDGPIVKRGNIYTVIDTVTEKDAKIIPGHTPEKGEYYILAEIGGKYAYHKSLFIEINEDQQDETEMERELIESHQIQG